MKKGDIPNKKFLFVILLTTLLLFLPTIQAVPQPLQTIYTGEIGINIEVNFMGVYEYGQPRWSVIHLFNTTNGFQINNITNDNITCELHLRDSQGFEIMKVEAEVHNDHWDLNGSGGGSNEVGSYAWTLVCQDGTNHVGGYASGFFDITLNGEELTEGKSTIYVIVTIFAFLIFALILFLFIYIDGSNPKDEKGDYTGLNYKKYVKTSLFPLVYVSFIWFFNFIIGLSNNFLGLTMYSNTLEFMFLIMVKLTFPIIVVTGIILLVQMVKDANIRKEYNSLWNRY